MSPRFIVKLFAGWTAPNNSKLVPPKATAAELVRRRPSRDQPAHHHHDHHSSSPADHHRRQSQSEPQSQQQPEPQPQSQPQREHQHRHQHRHQQQHLQQMINANNNNNNNNNNSPTNNTNQNNNATNTNSPNTTNQNQEQVQDPRDAKETAEDTNILRRFRIVQLIGTGNYARVYRGFSQSGRELAIKSINLSKTSENYKHKFLPRELTILKKISHPNICKIHEILQVSDRVYIIMQYCSRGTIADLLHRIGPFTEAVTRFLFVPTAEAVNYLHSMDLAHRDLKVENILLDHEYNPKLTDFSYSVNLSAGSDRHTTSHKTVRSPGAAAAAAAATTHWPNKQASGSQSPRAGGVQAGKLNETFCGTLPYLSPEMVRQQPYDPKKTDIWSLGVCLYIMLNDRAPFLFDDIKSMVKKQLTKDYKFRANVEFSAEVRELIAQMLEPDYNKRIGANGVIQHAWMSGERDKPTTAHIAPCNSLI